MNPGKLFRKLALLQIEINDMYYKTLEEIKTFPIELVTEQQQEDGEFPLIVDITDSKTGGIFSVYPIMINAQGEFIGLTINDDKKDNYSLEDIANEYNKIEMILILEQNLK